MAQYPPLNLPLPAAKKQRVEDDGPIGFKGFLNTEWRQLSNLFGGVEFSFQMVKFRRGSGVREYLEAMKDVQWTRTTFTAEFESMGGNKAESWMILDAAGNMTDVASGILAQFCSGIAYKQTDTFRKRLNIIRTRMNPPQPPLKERDMTTWQAEYVLPELADDEKDELLYKLLLVKFEKEPYKSLLLRTGKRDIGENDNRAGRTDRYTKGGGNVLGTLLKDVREELRDALMLSER